MSSMTAYNNGRIGMPALLGWDPMQLVDDLFSWRPLGGSVGWSALPVSVQQDQDHVTVSADMPGVDPKDLDITFERGVLAIAGKRGEQTYQLSVQVGDEIDASTIEAELDKGVLTIKAGKRPESKPRKIALKGAEAKTLASGEQA
jgi:HSP20 family molecular chaperone IbpA